MNDAKGLSAGTRKEYDRRVAVWVNFCARLTCQDGRPWNPNIFSWDVFELFIGSLLDEGATEEKCTKYQQALNDYFENLPGTARERPLLQGKGPVSRIMKKYEQVVLQRAADPMVTPAPTHSYLESWFSPEALRHLVHLASFNCCTS
jgi:hypothetical protein